MLIITQIESAQHIADLQVLLREYTNWAYSLEKGSEKAPTFVEFENEIANLPGVYGPPSGVFLIAYLDDQVAGCVALKGHDSKTSELKRLYVRPECRGHHLGARLVAELIDRGREIGYERIILDSHRTMTSAHTVYRAAGFRDVPAPEDFPDSLKPVVVFMEMSL